MNPRKLHDQLSVQALKLERQIRKLRVREGCCPPDQFRVAQFVRYRAQGYSIEDAYTLLKSSSPGGCA